MMGPPAGASVVSASRKKAVRALAAALLASSVLVLAACVSVSGTTSSSRTATAPPSREVPMTPTPSTAVAPALDSGPTQGATGESRLVTPGHYTYAVASGDSPFGIVNRFGLCFADLYGFNPGLDGHQSDLYIGETLTIGRVEGPYHGSADCLSGREESDAYP